MVEDLDTDQLLKKAAEGDEIAVSELFRRHRDRLRRMVAVRIDDRIAARVDPSDVVQETLVEAVRRLDDYNRTQPIPFYPWLRQLAWDKIVQLHRRHLYSQKRSVDREEQDKMVLSNRSTMELAQRLLAGQTSVPGRAMRKEMKTHVRQALSRLADKNREVLVLLFLERLAPSEAAAVLGISKSAVRSRQWRALEQFAKIMASYIEDDEK